MADQTLNLLLQVTGEGAGGEGTLDSLERKLKDFGAINVEATADVGTSDADKKIAALHKSLREVGAVTAEPKAEVSTGKSEATIAGLRARLAAIPDEKVTVEVNTDRLRAGITTALGLLGSFKIQAVFLIAALGGALIQAGAAVGALGVTAIGVLAPFGILAKGVMARLKTMKKGGQDVFKPLKDSFNSAFGPGIDATIGGMRKGLASLAGSLPRLRGSFTGFGKAVGGMLTGLLQHISSPAWTKFFNTMIGGSTRAVGPLGRAFTALLDIFKNIATAGLPILISLLGKGADALRGFADRSSNVESLRAKIQQGVNVLGQLLGITKNVGKILLAVFKGGDQAGAGFLQTLQSLTGDLARFLNTSRGQAQLRSLFSAMVPFVKELGNGLKALLPVFVRMVQVANTAFGIVVKVASALAKIPLVGPELATIAVAFLAWKGPLAVASKLLDVVAGSLLKIAKRAITKTLVTTAAVDTGASAASGAAGGAAAGAGFKAGLKSALKGLAAIIGGALVTALTSAAGLILAPIAGIVAAFFGLKALFTSKLPGWVKVGVTLIAVIIAPFLAIPALIIIAFTKIGPAIIGAIKAAAGGVAAAARAVFNGIVTAITAVIGAARTAILAVFNAVRTAISSTAGAIAAVARAVANGAVQGVRAYIGAGFAAGRAVFNAVRSAISSLAGAISGAARAVARGAVDGVRAFIGAGGAAGRAVFTAVRNGISAIGGAIASAASSVARGAIVAVRNFVDNGLAAGKAVFNAVRSGVASLGREVAGAAADVARGAVSKVREFIDNARSAGADIVNGLRNGIVGGIKAAAGAAADLGRRVLGAVKSFLGISSPSKAFVGVGGAIVSGLIRGLSLGDVTSFIGKELGGMVGLAIKLIKAGAIDVPLKLIPAVAKKIGMGATALARLLGIRVHLPWETKHHKATTGVGFAKGGVVGMLHGPEAVLPLTSGVMRTLGAMIAEQIDMSTALPSPVMPGLAPALARSGDSYNFNGPWSSGYGSPSDEREAASRLALQVRSRGGLRR